MLTLRPNCELCDKDLPPDATDARICTYECTFCAGCVTDILENVCPNCGGGFEARPVRPREAYRDGVSLAHQPPSKNRVHTKFGLPAIKSLSARLRDVPPSER